MMLEDLLAMGALDLFFGSLVAVFCDSENSVVILCLFEVC
jgi:hypothetical protein